MARVRTYDIWLPASRKLKIKLRRYRTSKTALAGSKDLILPTYLLLLPTKEICLQIPKRSRRSPTRLDLSVQTARLFASFGLITLGFTGMIYFSVSSQEAAKLEPENTFSVPIAKIQSKDARHDSMPRSEPKHLSIKSLGLEVPVEKVGIKSDKTMEVPPLFEHVTGWYKLGPSPGEIGPAVIVGHVDTYKGPSVFYRLKELKAGDVITVKRADNRTVKFKVVGLKQFSQDKFPTKEVYGNIDYAGLRLITCGGTFNEQTQRYTANTVVFARLVT